MKKIFSLFMVAAIVLTMSFAAMAAETVQGMHTIITETDSDITVTVKVGNVALMNSITSYIKTTAVTFVEGSVTKGEKVASWTVTPTTNKSGYIKFVVQTTDAGSYITESGEFEVLSYKVTKVKDGELETADFAYGTGTLDVSKVTTGSGGTVAGVDAGNNYTSKKQPAGFTVAYVDARTPVGGGDEGGDDPVVEPTEDDWKSDASWDATGFKYVDAAGNATTGDYAGKKVVAFGKNATGATLAANEYGIKIGANSYPGLEAVPAGYTFAIVLIDTNNDAKVKGTYTYSIWTLESGAEVTKASGLNAQ